MDFEQIKLQKKNLQIHQVRVEKQLYEQTLKRLDDKIKELQNERKMLVHEFQTRCLHPRVSATYLDWEDEFGRYLPNDRREWRHTCFRCGVYVNIYGTNHTPEDIAAHLNDKIALGV